MTDDLEDDSIAASIAAAIEEQQGDNIIDDLGRLSDDAPDSPDPENDESESGTSSDDGESADPTDEPDRPAAATSKETDPGPEINADLTDAHRQIAEAFGSAVSPYSAHLASRNVAAPQAFQALLAAEYQLSTGTPDQKARLLAQIAKDYSIDLDSLYGLEDRQPVNPELAQLQQRQAALERVVAAERQQAEAQVQQEIVSQVTAFASEKDAAGNLLYPHLEKVRDTMGRAIAENHELTLEQAYENAVWGEASLRKEALAKRRTPTPAGKSTKGKTKAKAKPAKEPSLLDVVTREYNRAVERASA